MYHSLQKSFDFQMSINNTFPNFEEINPSLNSSTKKHICKFCNKSFQWKSGLSRHNKSDHLKDKSKNYKCEFCDQVFYKEMGLNIHRKQHQNHETETITTDEVKKNQKISNVYGNIVSEIVYSSDSDCEYEILQTASKLSTNDNQNKNKCEYCGKTYRQVLSLQSHLKKHKEAPKDSYESPAFNDFDVKEDDDNKEIYKCNQCDKSFKFACNLANHMKIHLKQSIFNRKGLRFTRIPKYSCSRCRKVFINKVYLDNHLTLHNCNQNVKIESSSTKPYLCMVCGKAYNRASYLSIHMRTHTDYRPHLCSVCGKAFTIKRYLIVHSKIHTKERPYKCQHCSKGFIQKVRL